MSVAVAEQKKEAQKQIPEYLIYEVVKGQPIYYKGYKDVLSGTKTLEEIKTESILQSWLKAKITMILGSLLPNNDFDILTGELGLNLPEKTKRGADISIFKTENLELNSHFSNIPPEISIEIDIQADTENTTQMDYVHEKIEDYHNFGVKKVIWIFSKTKKTIFATPELPWHIYDWNKDIEILDGVSFNLNKLLEARKK